jgi:hypothetical protein
MHLCRILLDLSFLRVFVHEYNPDGLGTIEPTQFNIGDAQISNLLAT